MLVKSPKKLNKIIELEILKNYKEKMHFMDIIFQQDNAPVHKPKLIGNFFQRKRVESTGLASMQSRSASY